MIKSVKVGKIELVNLTPHEIVLFSKDGTVTTIFPSGRVLRIDEKIVKEKENDVKIVEKEFIPKEVSKFPKKENRYYIVSLPTLFFANRDDFIAPDTNFGAVRDQMGKIIGIKFFCKIKK
ncbi:hypothetical protein DRN73_05305 [Candidatus Pacearchaeota archaeon]|nr:MAG: hypothetical protein DRN73_05305 [Candidatus Pacearchaeota archaeon]